MQFLSSLLRRRRLTAAYSFMKALALPRFVVKVRRLCSRGSANVVEEGVPDSDLIVHHVRAGSRSFSRSARKSPHFFWLASSDSFRVATQASRYSARLPATVRRRAFRLLIASQSSGDGPGLGVSTRLRHSHMELCQRKKDRVEANWADWLTRLAGSETNL